MGHRSYHFVLNWQNIVDLMQLLEDVAADETAFIDLQVDPATREYFRNRTSGKVTYEHEPAKLCFELCKAVEPGKKVYSGYKLLTFTETKEDPSSGQAYPPDLFDDKDTQHTKD